MAKLLFLNCLLHLDELVTILSSILTFKIKINGKNNIYLLSHSQAIKDVYRKKLTIASYPLAHPLI